MVKKLKSDNEAPNETDFRTAMRGIKPLIHTKIPRTPAPIPPKRKPKIDKEHDMEAPFTFSDYEKLPAVDSEAPLYYAQSGVQDKTLRNLRSGYYNIEAILDLHGKTVSEARESLSCFLLQCQRKMLRHVLVIHGKGRGSNKPVLKNKLNHWLRQTDYVIAFCSATAKHGRQGALYVLLRRASLGK